MKKRLFKRVCIIFFFLITFFCLKVNSFAASFPYDKFDWKSFLEQHRDYWVSSYCEENDNKCVDEVLETKEKFYTRLYELLAQYDKKGYHIDDNIIIETVFYGLTPDSFKDESSAYALDDSSTKNNYIASDDGSIESAKDYFERETEVFNAWIAQICEALANPLIEDIYVDATHLNDRSREKTLSRLPKENIKKITNVVFLVPIETCLERNAQRTGREVVPEDTIRNMQKSFKMPKKYSTLIVDADGKEIEHG